MPLPAAQTLAPALSRTDSPVLYGTAGRVVAEVLARGDGPTPEVEELLDVMVASTLPVARAMQEHTQGALLLEVAGAMIIVALCRPGLDRRVRSVVRGLLDRVPPAAWAFDTDLLAVHGILEVAMGDEEVARRIACELDRREAPAEAAMLIRWSAGIRRQGVVVTPLEALETLAARLPGTVSPVVLLTAAWSLPAPTPLRSRAMVPRSWRRARPATP